MWKIYLAAVLATVAGPAFGQVKLGATLSTTGPAASLGIPERNTLQLLPKSVGGVSIEWVILDDASDTTAARKNAEKLTSEDKVDAIIGSSTTPNSLAMIEVANGAQTPMISLGASARIVDPMDAQRRWVFKTPYHDSMIAETVARHMKSTGVKTLAYIGFNDAYGEGWGAELQKAAERNGVTMGAWEKYNRTDTSVTAQVLKVMSANPDAVLIGASGTPAVLPQVTLRERGYKGKIYQTSGVINNDFLRVGGKNVEGTLLPSGPVIVVDQLPDDQPTKATGLEYKKLYEETYGPNSLSTFGANAYDAWLLLKNAIPKAAAKAKPGTPEFRQALRDEIEHTANLPATHGVFNLTAQDHLGFAVDAPAMITIRNGTWAFVKANGS
ncbi:ABC transporter substrate-binding protein [Bradyrhizobium sp. CCGB12]|uniref:ABC transporter substrate-binding protein n=1 Tax=Bradyrhizobium sp. CCGB12 TaxID=2949632 RepID=UPI0020B18DDA|nr:ABC transporter substrate-binding protein [Bradyrhizobium sp. CCGB12]MCP3387788.1 ABC transporter substrate-binding protein [Bradyrhizobium sp. CCGB12]